MKSYFKRIAVSAACIITSYAVFSQTTENFEPVPGIGLKQVTGYLENHCWQFSNLAVDPFTVMNGTGSLVSSDQHKSSALYTPVLNISGALTVSFKYAFTGTATDARSINIYLANSNNEIIRLVDNIDVSHASANLTYRYSNTISSVDGINKIYISYQGGSELPVIILDDFLISADKYYAGGCNEAPIAVNDQFTGSADRQASGQITINDHDLNAEVIACYLITDSKDGKVILEKNGFFSFTPNPGFTGNQTSFTYQVCDYGYNQLCSDEATVTLNFPEITSAERSGLHAIYNNKTVSLTWANNRYKSIDHFEIERSTDGIRFEKAGSVKAPGAGLPNQHYTYQDKVSEKFTTNNDLFYRIKQIASDGKINYSKQLLVRIFKTKTLASVTVTPNPAINDISVHLQLNEPAYVILKLRSVSGDEVIRKSIKGCRGDNSFTLEDSEKIRSGMYMLEVIINSNERMVIKLIKN